jgi:hypothetical protein
VWGQGGRRGCSERALEEEGAETSETSLSSERVPGGRDTWEAWRGHCGVPGQDWAGRRPWLSLPIPPNPMVSFGICLVPQGSEDKFDCYKCHWREGSMCDYGICE